MAKKSKLERIFIPPESKAVKNDFPTRESVEAVVVEILKYIEQTGATHTCPYHTHTKPERDARVIFVREFILPDRFRKSGHLVPCPCCWDEFGKFAHGMIAWFPDEKVIRIVGPTCFRGLNPEGYEWAMKEFCAEKKRQEDTTYLLSKLPQVPDFIQQVSDAIKVAVAIEAFHQDLHRKLAIIGIDLWRHVRNDGELRISEMQPEFYRAASGETKVRQTEVSRIAFRLQGFKILNERRKQLVQGLEKALNALKAIEFNDPADRVSKMDDRDKESTAKALSSAIVQSNNKIAEIEELAKFVEPIAINTLRNWARANGSPISFFCRHEGSKIMFGRFESAMVGVAIPDALYGPTGLLSVA